MKRLSAFVLAAAAVGAAVTAAATWLPWAHDGHAAHTAHAAHAAAQAEASPAPQEAGWYCPMHPDYTSAQAGSCPLCGMDLVQTAAGRTVRHTDQFHVPAEVQHRMGVVVRPAQALAFEPVVVVPAQLVGDERRAVSLSPKVEGWIRRLGVAGAGQPVRRGQLLFEIYSPELQQRQRDYIDLLGRRDALQARAGGMGATVGSATPDLMMASVARERFLQRSRLLAADVPEAVVAEIEQTRRVRDTVPVLAEHDGVVTNVSAREGAFVMPAQTVLSYADLGAVWAELSLTPEQLRLLGPRGRVTLRTAAGPLEAALPGAGHAIVDPATRLARLRVPLRSAGPGLRAGTLVDAEIRLAGRTALMVHKDAVIRTGHGDLVIVADGADHFRQVAVQLGAETRDEVEVASGLDAGEQVVVNGQFLLGAEASLAASRQRLAAAREAR